MRSFKFLIAMAFVSTCAQTGQAQTWWDQLVGKPHLEREWTHTTGAFDEGAAEIVAYDESSRRVFVTNGNDQTLDVLDATDGTLIHQIPMSGVGSSDSSPTSVAVSRGLVAVSVTSNETAVRGSIVFLDAATLEVVDTVGAGYLPDMVTFSPDGKYALVANEGEPSSDYLTDPEGSVTIIRIAGGKPVNISEAGFSAFNPMKESLQASGVRIYGPGATVSQDLEPEYIAVSADSKTAYVTLQENNAIAVVDIQGKSVVSVEPLGLKDFHQPGNELDASNDDDAINITNWPALGMYQPDAIAANQFLGIDFVFTANEGDARDYDAFSEEERVRDLPLDETLFPNADLLQADENLGRLRMTSATGDLDNDGDYDQIHAFGARSFSIWAATGSGLVQVYDSGSELETIVADQYPANFNSTNDDNDSFDNRSDDKGPEPEALTLGQDLLQTYCLVGLERMGGIMVYEVTNPFAPRFIQYSLNRNFDADAESADAGDLGPEGLVFIPRGQAPFVEPGVLVASEISGTTTMYRVKRVGGLLSFLWNE